MVQSRLQGPTRVPDLPALRVPHFPAPRCLPAPGRAASWIQEMRRSADSEQTEPVDDIDVM